MNWDRLIIQRICLKSTEWVESEKKRCQANFNLLKIIRNFLINKNYYFFLIINWPRTGLWSLDFTVKSEKYLNG